MNSNDEIAKGQIIQVIRNARLTGREDIIQNAGSIVMDFIEKGKASPLGTIQTYSGHKYVKTGDGWKPYKEGGIKTQPMGEKKEESKEEFSPAQKSFLERMKKQVIDNDDNSPWVEPWGDLNGKEIREKLGAKFKLSEKEFAEMNSKGIIKVGKTVTSRGAFAKVTIGKMELKNALKNTESKKPEGKKIKGSELVGKTMDMKDYSGKSKPVKIKSVTQEQEGGQYKIELEDGTSKFVNDMIMDKLISGKTHSFPKNPYSHNDDSHSMSIMEKLGGDNPESVVSGILKDALIESGNDPKKALASIEAQIALMTPENSHLRNWETAKVRLSNFINGSLPGSTGKSSGNFYKDNPKEDLVKEFVIDKKPYKAYYSHILEAIGDKKANKIISVKKGTYGFDVKYEQKSGSVDSRDSGEVKTFVSYDSIKNKVKRVHTT